MDRPRPAPRDSEPDWGKETREPKAMPFVNLQDRLGVNIDKWLLAQSGETRCKEFEQTRPPELEFEDFSTSFSRQHKRLYEMRTQKEKLMKEGKYSAPDHHTGKEEPRP
ncbi:NADH dehydrogenase [Huso huso]|uniref:NADH dehydrogenase n=1 Tax=Huso huso TaxID=61971 RepID=A0ABR0YP02_HUSHU